LGGSFFDNSMLLRKTQNEYTEFCSACCEIDFFAAYQLRGSFLTALCNYVKPETNIWNFNFSLKKMAFSLPIN
jgi:hypothetical protein